MSQIWRNWIVLSFKEAGGALLPFDRVGCPPHNLLPGLGLDVILLHHTHHTCMMLLYISWIQLSHADLQDKNLYPSVKHVTQNAWCHFQISHSDECLLLSGTWIVHVQHEADWLWVTWLICMKSCSCFELLSSSSRCIYCPQNVWDFLHTLKNGVTVSFLATREQFLRLRH